MKVDDLMEVMGAIAKLNRTVDQQQQMLDQYTNKFGPPEIAFAEEIADQEKKQTDLAKRAEQNGHSAESVPTN